MTPRVRGGESTPPSPQEQIDRIRDCAKNSVSMVIGTTGLPDDFVRELEAACKSIVRTRLCRSGMRWSREGGQRILNFRCYAKSGLWNEFWETYKQLRCSA